MIRESKDLIVILSDVKALRAIIGAIIPVPVIVTAQPHKWRTKFEF